MIRKDICENCQRDFEYKYFKSTKIRRFCSKKCGYVHDARRLSSYNDIRFQWDKATEEEKKEKLRENYEKYVVRKNGCWEWNGTKEKDGYGQIPCGHHKNTKAHRASWILHKGPIPEGMFICHKCDNPPCTNPDHLFLGTVKDNAKDMGNKYRGRNGTKNQHAKLKEEDIPKIRKRLTEGESFYKIAYEYGVKPTTIWSIRENKSWRHIQENKCERIERKTKLTKEDIIKIRELLEIGEIQAKIARDFGVTDMTIFKIKRRETWTHIEEDIL